MDREEREIITELLHDLTEDVIAGDMLPYLNCLTQDDKEYILCEERNYGYKKAAVVLLDRLQRRKHGFQQFVHALLRTGCKHLVDLIVLRTRQNGGLQCNCNKFSQKYFNLCEWKIIRKYEKNLFST